MKVINFKTVDKVLSFKKFENYKELILPEVCFAGRSNVGKSSLINSLLNRKGLAKTSKSPGQTKTILYYRVDSFLSLVDIPGYGYAKLSKKQIAETSELLNNYFTTSKNLKRVYILIDSRHGIKDSDNEFLSFLKKNKINYKYIFTKSDKLTINNKEALLHNLEKQRYISLKHIIFTSSKTKEGIRELKGNILKTISNNEKNCFKNF